MTVVIPAFNAVEWIGEALASVTAQTYPSDRLEIVVVDDGSTDGTGARARRVLAAGRIPYAVLRHESPLGPSTARNRGWRHGGGEWLQFLDADDLLEPSKIARQADVAAGLDGTVACLYSPWGRLVSVDGRWLPDAALMRPSVGTDSLLDILRTGSFLHVSSLLVARPWLQRTGGFAESYLFIEDVELLTRIIIQGGALKGVNADRALSWYRQRPGSLSRTSQHEFLNGCVRNARIADTYWSPRGDLTPKRAQVLAEVYFRAARYYAEHDRSAFETTVTDLYRVAPRFAPAAPALLRLLTKLVGYTRAERCAVSYRRFRRAVRA